MLYFTETLFFVILFYLAFLAIYLDRTNLTRKGQKMLYFTEMLFCDFILFYLAVSYLFGQDFLKRPVLILTLS